MGSGFLCRATVTKASRLKSPGLLYVQSTRKIFLSAEARLAFCIVAPGYELSGLATVKGPIRLRGAVQRKKHGRTNRLQTKKQFRRQQGNR